jgi:hypothetical protein
LLILCKGLCRKVRAVFQYSLQQRFQGALLGATIATTVPNAISDAAISDVGCAAALGQRITRDIGDALPYGTTHPTSGNAMDTDRLPQFTALINYLCQDTGRPIVLESRDALSLTPLWLYTHESWRQRRNWLERIFGDANTASDMAEQWLFSEAIAQVLRPDFRAATAVKRLRDQLTKHGHGTIADQLQPLAQWQADGAPLTRVITAVSSTLNPISSLLFALYCFLETPNMSAIAMARAQQLNDEGCAAQLTGVLLGAHQGWTGFPFAWLDQIQQLNELSKLSDQLLRSWSGAIVSVTPTPVSAPR